MKLYFRKIYKYQISWKSVQREPNFFHADGWTDRRTDIRTGMTNFEDTSRNFPNAPKRKEKKSGGFLRRKNIWGSSAPSLSPRSDANECETSQRCWSTANSRALRRPTLTEPYPFTAPQIHSTFHSQSYSLLCDKGHYTTDWLLAIRPYTHRLHAHTVWPTDPLTH